MNHPYPIGINPVPNFHEQDIVEARATFILQRAEEMKNVSEARETIARITDDTKMLEQIDHALEEALRGMEGRLIKTLDSCCRELARREWEESEQ